MIVIPRTSEQEHKLFLYLREVARQGLSTGMPEVYLYNLLHTRSAEAEQYGLQRTEELRNYVRADNLSRAIEESNSGASRRPEIARSFREGPGRGSGGTQALALIGAMYFMDRVEYAQLANQAANEISSREPIPGPRILIKGSPLHHTGLHQAIESHGAVVVAEDDWWGSRAPAKEIPQDGELVRAIFETCASYFVKHRARAAAIPV